MYTVMLDLDNTLFDIKPLLVAGFPNKGLYYPPTTYNIDKCYPKQVSEVINKLFAGNALYHTPLLFDYYIGVVNYLQRNYKVIYITHRKSREKSQKQLFDNRIQTNLDQIILTQDKTKMDEINKNKANFVVDDSPDVIKACVQHNIPHLMVSTVDTPYNHYLRDVANWAPDLKTLKQELNQRRQR